jgi:hypothetical protein
MKEKLTNLIARPARTLILFSLIILSSSVPASAQHCVATVHAFGKVYVQSEGRWSPTVSAETNITRACNGADAQGCDCAKNEALNFAMRSDVTQILANALCNDFKARGLNPASVSIEGAYAGANIVDVNGNKARFGSARQVFFNRTANCPF